MTIGEKIKIARTGRGITRRQLSEASDVPEISIKNYENGKRQPTIEQLKKISDGLCVNITYFFDASSPTKGAIFRDLLVSLDYHVLDMDDNETDVIRMNTFEGCKFSETEFEQIEKSVLDYTVFIVERAITEKEAELRKNALPAIKADIEENVRIMKAMQKASEGSDYSADEEI